MCHVLKISRSGYYKRGKGLSKRKEEQMKILNDIIRIRKEEPKKQAYGSPRMAIELGCSRKRVARIMRENGIYARGKRKFVVTTNSGHKNAVAPNLLKQNFDVPRPDMAHVTDITYIPTAEGWLYLATVMDLYYRRIIGWAMGKEIPTELTIRALHNAYLSRKSKPGTILHSDRGCQYASYEYRNVADEYGYIQSMSGKGNCYDNAVMESFFHTLKSEWVSWYKYKSRAEAANSIFDYIETFYNRERMHSKLGYLSPIEYEKRYASGN
jgi:transposase InsO family protein